MSSSLWNIFGIFSKLSAPNISRRSGLFFTSAAGLVVLLATAVYLRRKRKQRPSINPQECEDRNGNIVATRRTKRRRKRPRSRINELMPAGSVHSHYRKRHERENSVMSESSTVSSVKSSNSRHSRLSHIPTPGTKEYFEAERFYRLGVESFESAIAQWEKAGYVLQSDLADTPQSMSGRNSSMSHDGARTNLPVSQSLSETHTPGKQTPVTRSRKASGTRSRLMSGKLEAGDVLDPTEDETDGKFLNLGSAFEIEQKLEIFMERADRLQKSFEGVLYSESESESDTDITLTGYDDTRLSERDSDTASFVSAQEVWDTRSLEDYSNEPLHLALYESALEAVDKGCVRCRTLRTELLDCVTDVEFLAKLHCVRQALDIMLQDTGVRDWLVQTGRVVIELLLKLGNHDASRFVDAFDCLVEYVSDPDNWSKIEDELKGRKVVNMSFYDIVLDFIIMDSFDDLDRPPGSVLTVLNNRWLANSIKETALSTAVWSVLKAKSQLLRYPDGFIAKFYAVSESVSPVLAWGFLGPDEKLKSNCMKFKNEVLFFLRGIFSFEQVRYTNTRQLSDDILHLARLRMQRMRSYFGMAKS